MYLKIEGMLTAEEAAEELVRYAAKIADAIKRHDHTVFEKRAEGLKALLELLDQYVQQERQALLGKIPADADLIILGSNCD